MKPEIRKTTYSDLPTVMELFDKARKTMATLGIDQWQDGYPTENHIREDIKRGESYVVWKDGKIVATFMCMLRIEPTYQKIEGAWRSEKPYATIHRITVSPEARRSASHPQTENAKSISEIIMDFAKATAAVNQCDGGVRIDTHKGNIPMRKMIEKQGFVYCGVIWLETGAERVAYQFLPKA